MVRYQQGQILTATARLAEGCFAERGNRYRIQFLGFGRTRRTTEVSQSRRKKEKEIDEQVVRSRVLSVCQYHGHHDGH